MTERNILGGEFVTIQEAAKMLDVSERTLVRWHHKGYGPEQHRLGRRRVYQRRRVAEFIQPDSL